MNSSTSEKLNGHVGMWERMSDERLAEQCLACERKWWELNDRIEYWREKPAYLARGKMTDLRCHMSAIETGHQALLEWIEEHRPEVFKAVSDA